MSYKLHYKTIEQRAQAKRHTIKGSKFLGYAFPVFSLDEIKDILTKLRKHFADATHLCSAYRLGTQWQEDMFGKRTILTEKEKADDDGEPAYSAGKPILQVLQGADLHNILIVVVRYYGGVNLGIGGLIKAYGLTAKETLQRATIIEKSIKQKHLINLPFTELHTLMHYTRKIGVSMSYASTNEEVIATIELCPTGATSFFFGLDRLLSSYQRQ